MGLRLGQQRRAVFVGVAGLLAEGLLAGQGRLLGRGGGVGGLAAGRLLLVWRGDNAGRGPLAVGGSGGG